jgi:hypothetical protein
MDRDGITDRVPCRYHLRARRNRERKIHAAAEYSADVADSTAERNRRERSVDGANAAGGAAGAEQYGRAALGTGFLNPGETGFAVAKPPPSE